GGAGGAASTLWCALSGPRPIASPAPASAYGNHAGSAGSQLCGDDRHRLRQESDLSDPAVQSYLVPSAGAGQGASDHRLSDECADQQAIRERTGPSFSPRPGAATPDELLIGFAPPLPAGVQLVGRLHPLTEALAEYL